MAQHHRRGAFSWEGSSHDGSRGRRPFHDGPKGSGKGPWDRGGWPIASIKRGAVFQPHWRFGSWSKLKKRVAHFHRLQAENGLLLVLEIFGFAALLPLFLLFPLPSLLRHLEPRRKPRSVDPEKVARIERCVDAVIELGKPLIRSRCLTRTLTHFFFLSRAGLELEVCFGMGKRKGELVGHCWLMRGGAPYLEAEDPRCAYAETYVYPQREGARPGEAT
ncbi:MAG: lasso peptide biosynthesis B2 protein [Deltaproteobacteria bacterium]|nr:MAG: lasso peptide biosynthesis B2 protein [Deltaproteobacteria bacterium]